jgi:hypothetical protein
VFGLQATKAELKAIEEKKKKEIADKKDEDKRAAASLKVLDVLFYNRFRVVTQR